MDPEQIEKVKELGLLDSYLVDAIERGLQLLADIATSLETIAAKETPP